MDRVIAGLLLLGSAFAQSATAQSATDQSAAAQSATNTTISSTNNAGEIAGYSIGIGVLSAVSILTCATTYMMRQRQLGTGPCPYCEKTFPSGVLRDHLQTCEEHLKHYRAVKRGTLVRELSRDVFYERVPPPNV
jgi:hypothetical protein